jgi:alpha-galactosidase
MKKMILMTALLCSMGCLGYAHESNESLGGVSWNPKVADYIQFECNDMGIALQLPRIELNHRMQQISLSNFEKSEVVNTLRNGGSEFTFKGQVNGLDNVSLMMKLRTYPGSKILRFQYAFADKRQNYCMTKSDGHDAISYLSVACPQETQIREIRLSEYNDMIHATHLTGYDVSPSAFETDGSVMGPILTMTGRRHSFLIAYEHGSQYPDRFFGYSFLPNHSIELRAQKGNYMDGDKLDGFKTVWFEISAVAGDENMLSDEYRKFVLDDLSESGASRLPYLYYNTWGRQERVKWSGGSYLQSMNLETILSEIDRAHELGMDYYVIDTGWFEKTGDWRVSTTRFP